MRELLTRLCIGVLLAMTFSSCAASRAAVKPGRYAVLPSDKARDLVEQCSRSVPKIDGTWQPSDAEIAALEKNLPRLVGTRAAGCCIQGGQLREVDSFFRQYAGVVVEGRRVIYINAFPISRLDDWPPTVERPDWTKDAFIACDGGSSFWGAIYDPARRTFSDLSFNGIA